MRTSTSTLPGSWQVTDGTSISWRPRLVLDPKRVRAVVFGLLRVSVAELLREHRRWISLAWDGSWSQMRLRQHWAWRESVLRLTCILSRSITQVPRSRLILKSSSRCWPWLGTVVWHYHSCWSLLKYIWCTASQRMRALFLIRHIFNS